MKTPRLKELKRLNKLLERSAWSNYLRVLYVVAAKYSRVTGDTRILGLLRSKQFALLYAEADVLVATVHATAAKHFAAHQLAALIRKYPWDPAIVKLDPEASALRTFLASEHRCKWMNRWALASYRRNADNEDVTIRKMRSFIRYVLGTKPDLGSILAQCDVTAGASIGVSGDATNLGRKLSVSKWSVTPTALPYFAAALEHLPHYATKVARGNGQVQSLWISENDLRESCELVDYNKVAFVPKTAKTHRSIAVEPLGNGLVQKGIDLEMRKRLKRIGINLQDQSLNQRLSREGSLTDSEEGFCTIDLSAASDSISIGLVKLLLPPAWFRFMDRVRSPSYRLPSGETYRYEKFCSMGNGFCFPLETLIFAAACHALGCGRPGSDFSVYGDDIIVRKKYFGNVVALLRKIGFKTNKKKTFADGPFRESCGGNWYNGEDVTPFTLDFELDSLSSYFKFVNLARRNARTSAFLSDVVSWCITRLPEKWRFFRPHKGPEDSAIDFGDLQFDPRWGWRREFQTLSWLELQTRPRADVPQDPWKSWVVMAGALRGSPSEQQFTVRRKVSMRIRRVPGVLPGQVIRPGDDENKIVSRQTSLYRPMKCDYPRKGAVAG